MSRMGDTTPGLYPPHVRGSQTSLAAAVSISGNRNSMHNRIIALLKEHPEGQTDEQISNALQMLGSTARPRRIELVASGVVRDSGKKARTTSRRLAVLWVLV